MKFKVDDKVRVNYGWLSGAVGTVIALNEHDKYLVSIDDETDVEYAEGEIEPVDVLKPGIEESASASEPADVDVHWIRVIVCQVRDKCKELLSVDDQIDTAWVLAKMNEIIEELED